MSATTESASAWQKLHSEEMLDECFESSDEDDDELTLLRLMLIDPKMIKLPDNLVVTWNSKAGSYRPDDVPPPLHQATIIQAPINLESLIVHCSGVGEINIEDASGLPAGEPKGNITLEVSGEWRDQARFCVKVRRNASFECVKESSVLDDGEDSVEVYTPCFVKNKTYSSARSRKKPEQRLCEIWDTEEVPTWHDEKAPREFRCMEPDDALCEANELLANVGCQLVLPMIQRSAPLVPIHQFLSELQCVKRDRYAKQLSSEVDAILFDLPDNLLENALFILCRGHERSIRCDPVMNMNLISLILNRLKFHKSAKHPRIHPISSSRKKDVFALFAVKHFQQIIRLVCLAFSLPDERLLSFYESEVTRMIQDEDYLSKGSLTKSIRRWCTLYGLDEERYAPHSYVDTRRQDLRFLVHATYRSKALSIDAFVERVDRMLCNNYTLSSWFVRFLEGSGKISEASFWADRVSLSPESYSPQIRQKINMGDLGVSDRKQLAVDPSLFHTLRIGEENIFFVGDISTYRNVMKILLEKKMVGLDCEWLSTSVNNKKLLSIIQIATEKEVFLFDMLKLKPLISGEDGVPLVKFFSSSTVMKICYDFNSDTEMLDLLCAPRAYIASESKNIFDLETFHSLAKRNLLNQAGGKNSSPGNKQAKNSGTGKPVTGLAAVVKAVLGKPLDKRECMSDWERRPLRREQMRYAALDAFCLVEIYLAVAAKAEDMETDFKNIFESYFSTT
ncbi:unnamed protein product [Notodromas monacha]|uniref:3'-5' exonuclease domain-containing protein n=1 Tax=Notodromas monacha TaxID=399045 RepID=A0A7R9BVK8_9CRUS|nr:unnamed protein product [Notodromas monacha]CAG0920931.1 unnamed protein product [Notodromas monacha]